MDTEKTKNAIKVAQEISDSKKELNHALRTTQQAAGGTKILWKEGNQSKLIKIGVTCIMLPDPTPVTTVLGAGLVAAGAVQKGIKSQGIYLNDIKKVYESTFKELANTKSKIR